MALLYPFNFHNRIDVDLPDRLMACKSAGSIVAIVNRIALRMGFEHWIYEVVLPITTTQVKEFVINNYPGSWQHPYLLSRYDLIDPIFSCAYDNVIPSIWGNLTLNRNRGSNLGKVKPIFRKVHPLGLVTGISVPLHGLGCLFGAMSYVANNYRHPILESTLYAEAAMLAACVHQAALPLINRGGEDISSVTLRERDVLKWAAEGKSSWEIAQVLDISERTAIFHLANAIEKLGIKNRHQAVAKALLTGLFDD